MKFRGVNHLAMVTNDMDKTIRFYRDVLGMQLVGALGSTPERSRLPPLLLRDGPKQHHRILRVARDGGRVSQTGGFARQGANTV